MKHVLFFVIIAITAIGCKKTEGEGGAAKIRGKVFIIDFKTDESLRPDTMLASEEDIYISYGTSDIVNNKNTTNQKGEYGFDYMRSGKYSIIAFSKQPELNGADTTIVKTVEISDKKSTVNVEHIYLYKAKEGYATIKGRVFVKDYNNTTLKPKSPEDSYYSGGEDIFIQKVGSDEVLKKEITNDDGTFVFKRLSTGAYKIYAYSKDTIASPFDVNQFSSKPLPSIITCRIDTIGQKVVIPNIVIIR